jgi:CspA family cold shock protein
VPGSSREPPSDWSSFGKHNRSAQAILDRNQNAVVTGTVKLFHPSKGYGFIRQDTGGRDVFVHLSVVQMAGLTDLRKGQRVSFEIFDNQGKPAAKNLHIHDVHGTPSDDRRISAGVAQDARDEMSPKKAERLEEKRKPITKAELETALADAVRARDAQCEGLVAIIVERASPASPAGTNWSVKGVKYGKAERDRCDAALSICLEEMQRQFEVSG